MGTESNETIATEKIDSMFDERSNMEVLKDGTLCKDAMMKCRIIYLFFEPSMKDFQQPIIFKNQKFKGITKTKDSKNLRRLRKIIDTSEDESNKNKRFLEEKDLKLYCRKKSNNKPQYNITATDEVFQASNRDEPNVNLQSSELVNNNENFHKNN